MDKKKFTKTLRLRIVRPFYNDEIEDIIQKEKDRKEAEAKNKKARKLSFEFWEELKQKYPDVVSPVELFDVFRHIQREIIPIYNKSSALLYQKILQGLKAKRGNERKAVQYVTSDYAYHLAYKTIHDSHIALGIGIKLRSSFSGEKLRKIQRAEISSPSATSESFPVPVNVNDGFKISTSSQGDFILNVPLPWYEVTWITKQDKKTGKEKKYRQIQLKARKEIGKTSLNNLSLLLSTLTRKKKDNWQKDFSTEAEIKKVMAGEYKVKYIELIKGKRVQEGNYWFVNLVTTFERPIKQSDRKIVGGIDIGVSNPIVCAINGKLNRLTIQDNDVMDFTKAEIARLRSARKGDRYRRGGHGIKHKFAPSETIQRKYDERRKKKIEEWASRVTKFFVSNGVGLVYMEDIDSREIKRGEDYFSVQLRITWPVSEMMSRIQKKLEDNGIEVKKRNPAFSSQICSNSNCGKWNRNFTFEYRKENNFPPFECKSCDFGHDKENFMYADYNAARNLANPNFERVVKENIPQDAWGKYYSEFDIED